MIWSAARMTSGSCSTTMMVLPRSRSSPSIWMRRAVSRDVQSDRRLVENVAGAHQPRAEAGGELDALRFAARQRRRQPVEREVFEAHVVEELKPLVDLDQDLAGDAGFFGRQFQGVEERRGFGDIHAHRFGDGLAADASRRALLCAAATPPHSGQRA